MNIISIDPSKTCTGIFLKVDGEEKSFNFRNQKIAQEIALKNIYNEIYRILYNTKMKFGLIEGYWLSNPRGMTIIPEIVGVIRLAFCFNETPLVTIPIQTWKSIIKIKINKKKYPEKYLKAIKIKYGKTFNIIDEADAFLIYVAAREVCKRNDLHTRAAIKIRDTIRGIIK